MSGIVIDRREDHKAKSTTSRDRFIKRYKQQIKDAVADSVKKSKGFKSFSTPGKEHDISIDKKGITEPWFHHGQGGDNEFVLGGNDRFIKGDTIPKPRNGGGGSGSSGSPNGEDVDSFTFALSRAEFLDMIFDGLSLPDLVKKNLQYSTVLEYVHAGFTKQGSPGNMDVPRSFKMSLQRRIGLFRKRRKQKLQELENELEALGAETQENTARWQQLLLEIIAIKQKLKAIPYFDPAHDLRYRHREQERNPTTSAVMFCLMDVSGSMDENMKHLAKGFFLLLHLFLQRNYKNVDVVFIRHTQTAEVVNEETFFYATNTGGTMVSSCLIEMIKVIEEKYDPRVWNIYAAQASDGDNWDRDNDTCRKLLREKILNLVQYMVYIEVGQGNSEFGELNTNVWAAYRPIADESKNFQMRKIYDFKEIYPTFRSLFETKPGA